MFLYTVSRREQLEKREIKMSDNSSPEYVAHNFAAVDNQIHEIAKRERARTLAYRLESAKLILLYVAIGALVLAIFLYILSWAYRTIMAPYPTEKVEVVQPQIVEKEVIRIVKVPIPIQSNENPATENHSDNNVSYNGPSIDSNHELNVVTNYNIFRTVETTNFETYGVSKVITGWRYSSSEDSFPSSQYCYAEKLDKGATAPITIVLGNVRDNNQFESNVTRALSREVGVPVSVLKKMESNCNWASI